MKRCLALFAATILLGGCSLFTPRTPEEPTDEGGTYLQPDEPDDVLENMQAAVAELNAANYRRAFADEFVFVADPDAAREYSVLNNWTLGEETGYFQQLAESAQHTSGNSLVFEDTDCTYGISETRCSATYTLRVNHDNTDVSRTLRGQLLWELRKAENGLWYLTEWTDRALGSGEDTWSKLKAEFVQ